MQIDSYLARIGYTGPREPTFETLAVLHRTHMTAVPFENLDIPTGRGIRLDPDHLYDKIVRRRRGGYCFELNGLFGWLLGRLGYPVTLLSARVFGRTGFGPDLEHALLLVDGPTPTIADVGFGDSFLTPLPLQHEREEVQSTAAYRLTAAGPQWTLEQRPAGGEWSPQYAFTLAARKLEDFIPMSHHLSTSAESPFTRKAVCSRATAEGRVTLSGSRLIQTTGGHRTETMVTTVHGYRACLRRHFAVELEDDVPITRLMALTPPAR